MRVFLATIVFYLAEFIALLIGGSGLLALMQSALDNAMGGLMSYVMSLGMILAAILLLVLANIGHVLVVTGRHARAHARQDRDQAPAARRNDPPLSATSPTQQGDSR